MNKHKKEQKFSKRQRKIGLAVFCTLLGTAALVAIALLLAEIRETDLADASGDVTASFVDAGSEHPTPFRFRNVAEEMGVILRHGPGPRTRVLPEDTGSGLAWGDYDGDGDWDLYIVNFPGPLRQEPDSTGYNRLFRNDGDHFTDVTHEAGVADLDGFGMGASFADYDDDGDVDLYVTNFGKNRLFRNRGDGTFEEVAAQAGVADSLWSCGVAWGDYDRDGHLDLYVTNYVHYDDSGMEPGLQMDAATGTFSIPFTLNPNSFDPQPNRLYRNRGDGTFEEVAVMSGVSNPRGRSFAATFTDFDGDGWLDLYVNNDVSTNKLFRNRGADFQGEGVVVFQDISTATGTADPRGSMGLSVAEIGTMTGEADGLPDLFITHWVAQENALYQSFLTADGRLEYRDKTRHLRLGEISIEMVGWGSAFADFDLDGNIDLAVANGSTLELRDDPGRLKAEPVFLFRNSGRIFYNTAATAGEALRKKYWARGLAVADFDADGDVDIAIAVNRGQPLLLRNDTETGNHALTVLLAGSSAVCFGAKIEVRVKDKVQLFWYGSDVTFLGMHAPEAVFGLGANTSADEIKVTWADGKTTSIQDVPAGRLVVRYPAE